MSTRFAFKLLTLSLLVIPFTVFAQKTAQVPNPKLIQSQESFAEAFKKKAPADLRIFKPVPLPAALKAEKSTGGGWGSSGGGSGIACFKTLEAARAADVFIADNRRFSKEILDQIEQLQTLEYWEWTKNPELKLSLPKATTLLEAVHEIHKRITWLAPLFAYRLEQAAGMIELSEWNENTQVPRIMDAKPTFELESNCRQVQIAGRYTRESYDVVGVGPSKKVPTVKVDVNFDLFNKLDLVNQTFLVLHEQIYLLAQVLGHKNSDGIRHMVTEFFSEGYVTAHPTSKMRYFLKDRLVRTFGDYVNYFGDDLTPDGPAFTQESRLKSFYILLNGFRKTVADCKAGLLTAEKMASSSSKRPNRNCHDVAMDRKNYEGWMTDEMAFLFIVHFQFDVAYGYVNAEYMMTPFLDKHYLEISEGLIGATCGIIKKNAGKLDSPETENQAIRYCDEIIPRLVPKGKGQN